MSQNIDQIATEVEKKYFKVKDSGRKNELRIALKFSLNKIANRIDHGYNIDIRIAPPSTKGGEKHPELEDAIGESFPLL